MGLGPGSQQFCLQTFHPFLCLDLLALTLPFDSLCLSAHGLYRENFSFLCCPRYCFLQAVRWKCQWSVKSTVLIFSTHTNIPCLLFLCPADESFLILSPSFWLCVGRERKRIRGSVCHDCLEIHTHLKLSKDPPTFKFYSRPIGHFCQFLASGSRGECKGRVSLSSLLSFLRMWKKLGYRFKA